MDSFLLPPSKTVVNPSENKRILAFMQARLDLIEFLDSINVNATKQAKIISFVEEHFRPRER